MIDLLAASSAANRALWTTPLPREDGAPRHRIIHARGIHVPSPVVPRRIGLRLGTGYFKCGSVDEVDWVTAFRLHAWHDDAWRVAHEEQDLPRPGDDGTPLWFDLPAIETPAILLEARRCGIDEWWPSWNVAASGFILEAAVPTAPDDPPSMGPAPSWQVGDRTLDGLPQGVSAAFIGPEVRYRTRFLEVGFRLRRAAFSYFALDDEGLGRTQRNLLRLESVLGAGRQYSSHDYFAQGVRLHLVGKRPTTGFLPGAVVGTTQVSGNTVLYDVQLGHDGPHYRLHWEVWEDRLILRAECQTDRLLRVWTSSAWHMAFDSRVTPTTALGRITREGETGLMTLPVLVHAPGHGTLRVSLMEGAALWRSDSIRPYTTTTGELKLGEAPQPEGDYVIPLGRHSATIEMTVARDTPVAVDGAAPPAVERALRRCTLTSLTYRPDTATMTNNGNSIHAPICMDLWGDVATRIGAIVPGLPASDLLRQSLERWLDGGPGYASGRTSRGDHLYEDEYLMSGTASLLGLALYLQTTSDAAWLARYRPAIEREIGRMRARDLDGDGLIESPWRLGVSGSYEWSTCWYDVISFGWKDAFSNALLYDALRIFAEVLPRLGQPALTAGIATWADHLRATYLPTFYNADSGWLAGWRCKEDKLHDYAFLFVNGAAVCSGLIDDRRARAMMERLWAELQRVGFQDYRLGLPGNLWPIPDTDMAAPQHGLPMGSYQNGGATHSQARHFVRALYRVGLRSEADLILEGLCASLGDGTAFAGCGSGVDWRCWDGALSGYEGLLCDQFGVIALALERHARGVAVHTNRT